MEGALEGLPGILDVSFTVESERFDIAYDADRTSPAAIFDVVRDLGFEPAPVTTAADAPPVRAPIAIAELPDELRALFAEARRVDRPLLFHFTAPG